MNIDTAIGNTLNNAVNTVNSDITNFQNTVTEGYNNFKNSVGNTVSGGINSYVNFSADVLGINAAALNEVPTAIQEYVRKIDEVIQGIEKARGEIKYDAALKGETQTSALDNYIGGAIETIKTVTNTMNKFGDAIVTVQQNYLSEEGNVAGNMGSVAQQDITAKTGVSGFDG